ncbi:hypothetical protein LWT08_22260, partial [Enterobacter hormaechei]|nr:hypothetical protein [Enterobacter hormaechei]
MKKLGIFLVFGVFYSCGAFSATQCGPFF